MSAAVVVGTGKPWEIREVPVPAPGPDEVLIKIAASGLCHTDVHFTNVAPGDNFPMIFGHEPVGTVAAIGEAVTTRRIGDRVGTTTTQRTCGRCEWCLSAREISCPNPTNLFVHVPGGHAEYLVAVDRATTLIPDELSFEQAAPLFCAGYTVMGGLLRAGLKPHDRVAVLGVGGLGHLAIQYAKALGHETIAVTRSADKSALAKQLGADKVVDAAAELLNDKVDVVLSTANSYAPAIAALTALRPDGRLVLIGIADGDETFTIPSELVFPAMMVNRWSVLGSQQNEREALTLALRFAAEGKIRALTEAFPLEKAAEAFNRVARGEARFRVVLVPH